MRASLGIDPSAALEMPGVLGVYTGADCVADGLKDIPHDPVPSTQFDVRLRGRGNTPVFIGSHMLLPADKARYVGEAIAMVVAETRQQAYSAAEMVAVDYEELPWVADTVKATAPDAPRVWDELPDNILVDSKFGDARGDRCRLCACGSYRHRDLSHRPRHGRTARAARGARLL